MEVGFGAGASTRMRTILHCAVFVLLPPALRGEPAQGPRFGSAAPPKLLPSAPTLPLHAKVPLSCGPSPVFLTGASYRLGRAWCQLKIWDSLFRKQEKCATKSTKVYNFSLLPWALPLSLPVAVLGFAIQCCVPVGTGTLARHGQTLTHTHRHSPPATGGIILPAVVVGRSVSPSHRPAALAHAVSGYYYYYYYCCLL